MENHQRMVESLTDRLRKLKGEMSLAAFGELAGVSAQAAKKWMDGGNVADKHLSKIAGAKGVSLHWLRYGDESRKPEPESAADLTREAVEVARAWMRLPDYKRRGYAQGIMVDAAVVEVFPEIERAMRLAATAADPAYHKFTEKFSKARDTMKRQLELDLKSGE